MKTTSMIAYYMLSTLHNFLTLGGSYNYAHFIGRDTVAHGDTQFSHRCTAYEGDSNTSLCAFEAAVLKASSILLCNFATT